MGERSVTEREGKQDQNLAASAMIASSLESPLASTEQIRERTSRVNGNEGHEALTMPILDEA